MDTTVVAIKHLKYYRLDRWVLEDVNFTADRGEIVALVGASGSGKTTLLRSILMLEQPASGSIQIFGKDVLSASPAERDEIRRRWGVMFQQGALFSSLTVLENVLFPLQQFSILAPDLQKELALLKIVCVGLPPSAAHKYPAQLSGGMKKRAAVARALALDPELLLLDEPASGLDPRGVEALDALILRLRDALGLTVIMVTHNLGSLHRLADRIAFLSDGRVIAQEHLTTLKRRPIPDIQAFFGELSLEEH